MKKKVLMVTVIGAMVLLIGSISVCARGGNGNESASESEFSSSSFQIPENLVDVERVGLDKKSLYF